MQENFGSGNSMADRMPRIRRARGYYLYDEGGKRYLDLYQNGGRAILGHRPDKVYRELKNTLSRGLLAEYPSIYDHRFLKALKALFPGYSEFRWYHSRWKTLHMLKEVGIVGGIVGAEAENTSFPDPVFGDGKEGGATGLSLWRPFLESDTSEVDTVVPVLPFPADTGISVICSRARRATDLPPSDRVSPVFLVGLSRAIYDLLSYYKTVERDRWTQFESSFWFRKGPYLVPRCDRETYYELYYQFLEHKIFISPFVSEPSIIPAAFTQGDIAALSAVGRLSI